MFATGIREMEDEIMEKLWTARAGDSTPAQRDKIMEELCQPQVQELWRRLKQECGISNGFAACYFLSSLLDAEKKMVQDAAAAAAAAEAKAKAAGECVPCNPQADQMPPPPVFAAEASSTPSEKIPPPLQAGDSSLASHDEVLMAAVKDKDTEVRVATHQTSHH